VEPESLTSSHAANHSAGLLEPDSETLLAFVHRVTTIKTMEIFNPMLSQEKTTHL